MDGIRTLNVATLEQPYEGMRVCHPRAESRLLVSMQAMGQKTPLIVIAGSGVGAYAVVDGHKRLRALKKLKADVAQAEVWETPAAEALVRAYRIQQGAWNALEEGALVEELHRGSKWSLRKIAEELERTEGWASRRLGLVKDLPDAVVAAVQQGKIGAYSAMKYLLPLARAKFEVSQTLAAALSKRSFTTRQVRLLYEHCLNSPSAVTDRILADPSGFLKALEASGQVMDLALNPSENKVLEHLRLIGNVSLGLVRRLPELWPSPRAAAARKKFMDAWRRCRECVGYLEKTVKDLSAEQAGPGQVDAGS